MYVCGGTDPPQIARTYARNSIVRSNCCGLLLLWSPPDQHQNDLLWLHAFMCRSWFWKTRQTKQHTPFCDRGRDQNVCAVCWKSPGTGKISWWKCNLLMKQIHQFVIFALHLIWSCLFEIREIRVYRLLVIIATLFLNKYYHVLIVFIHIVFLFCL